MTPLSTSPTHDELLAALRWQVEAGADEAIADVPIDRFATAAPEPIAAPMPQVAAQPRPMVRSSLADPTSAPLVDRPSHAPPPAPAPIGDGPSAHALASAANS